MTGTTIRETYHEYLVDAVNENGLSINRGGTKTERIAIICYGEYIQGDTIHIIKEVEPSKDVIIMARTKED